jgi:hypothetical protein
MAGQEQLDPIARVTHNERMQIIATSTIVAGCVFAAGLAGVFAHWILPASHRSKETQEVVRLATGMLSVLASLVLGLLIATAKTTYDTTDRDIRSYAADLILLDETLRDYGDPATSARDAIRRYTVQALEDNWPSDGTAPMLDDQRAGAMLEHLRERIRALRPVDDGQKWLMNQALDTSTSLLHQRWRFIEQTAPNVQPITLAILVSWIMVIFVSFGLNAPRNGTVVAAFLVCAMAIGGSVFLILEMDEPLQGALKISSAPMRNALAHMKPGPE